MVIITPLLALQAMQIGSKVAAEVVDDPKVKNKLRIFNQIAQLSSLAGAFKSPSTGTGLGIADSKSYEAFKKMPEGIFGGALLKGGNFDLPKGLIDGGFGLEMPKGWNITPKTKGIFDPPGKDEIGWIGGL